MTRSRFRGTGVALLTLASTSVEAGGFTINDKSVSALGRAFAGAAALAEDASAVYNNPALLTALDGSQLALGAHLIRTSGRYEDGDSNTGGPTSADIQRTSTLPNIYFVTQLSPTMSAGFGLYLPSGVGLDYDADWRGRYHTIESQLQTFNLSPSLAWDINEHIAFGASLNMQYARAKLHRAMDFGSICVVWQMQGGASQAEALANCTALGLLPQASDGAQRLSGNGWSHGFSLGIAMQSIDGRGRAGLVFHGPIHQALKGPFEFDDVPEPLEGIFTAGENELAITLPESVSLSFAYEATERLTVLADYTWTRWSRFKELRLTFDNDLPDSVTPQNWNNVARYSVGVNYRLNPTWLLRAGIALDETPVPSATLRSPLLPDDDRHWYSLGVNWMVSTRFSLDAAYAYVPAAGTTSIDNTDSLGHNLKGSYRAVVGQYLSLQGNWRF